MFVFRTKSELIAHVSRLNVVLIFCSLPPSSPPSPGRKTSGKTNVRTRSQKLYRDDNLHDNFRRVTIVLDVRWESDLKTLSADYSALRK